jgi:hypothetical protein
MIAGRNVIQDGQAIPPLRLKEPASPAAPISLELQQELSLVTAMRDMPDVARAVDAVSSRHLVELSVLGQKRAI